MEYKGQSLSGRDIATVELLEEIKAYFSEDGAALNALALGGVNATSYALKADVDKSIADLVGAAPEALDTLYEISAVLQENVADIDTILTQIGTKANQTALDEAVGRITTLENSATKVSFAQTLTGGTKIGSITIDGTATNIYAPSLSGYATQSWVNQQGYITGINYYMVRQALGYEPINETWINNQGFATEAFLQANYVSSEQLVLQLKSYATTEYVDGTLTNDYYKKSEVYTTSEVLTLLGSYVEESALLNYVPSTGGTFNALAIGYNFASIGTYKLYVNGRTYIAGSLKIGDATLSWDSTNNALKVDKPMYSTGTIASGGVAAAASQLTTLEARVKALEDKVNKLI